MRVKDSYLKKFPLENPTDFTERKSQCVLFNKYEKAVLANCGLILKREPELTEDEKTDKQFFETFKTHWENIDSAGTHGTVFVNQFVENMFAGHAFIVVDAPSNKGQDVAEQKALGWRPYWNLYTANQAISWRTGIVNNQTVLTQIVFHKKAMEFDGDFGEKEVDEFKVYRLTKEGVAWMVFRYAVGTDGKATSNLVQYGEPGLTRGMTRLPIAIGYGKQKGFAVSVPPFKDLAYENIRLLNKESDYDKADAYAGLVFMVALGDAKIDGAASDLLVKCESGADFQLRETSGMALEAKRALLDRIEKQMDELGLTLLMERPTATQAKIDDTHKTSELSRIAFSAKDAIETAIEIHGDFMNIPSEKVCSIDLGFKADQLVLSAQTAQMLLQACIANKLSVYDFLSALKLGGVMPDSFNLDEAVQRQIEEMKQQPAERVMQTAA